MPSIKQVGIEAYWNEFVEAWNRNDADRVLGYFADDGLHEDPVTPEPVKGKENIRGNSRTWFEAFQDVRFDVRVAVQGDREAAVLSRASGVHNGDFVLGPGQRLPATGNRVEVDVGYFLDLDANGRITREVVLFDTARFMAQLGVTPEQMAAMSPS